MGTEKGIMDILDLMPDGVSTSDIAEKTGHTRATVAKYLELMKLQDKVTYREVGKTKLWARAEKKKKILITDDEANIRRLITVILQQDEYDFIEAKDGSEALEKVGEEMPDLVILDLMMPKIDGMQVCSQLKSNALTRKIPIIMLTAKNEMSDKVLGIKTGADDYLTKPFEPRELRIRVKTFLDRGRKERNPITNLPTYEAVFSKLKFMDEGMKAYCLFFKNIDAYKKNYGFSKTNEAIRLTSQIISHNFENFGQKNFAGHDADENFIIAIEKENSEKILTAISEEFESTIPFFYDADYDKIKLKKSNLIELVITELKKEELKDSGSLKETLIKLRENG